MSARRGARSLIAVAATLCLWTPGIPQSSPKINADTYRSAYRAWREAEPDLERDAATAQETVAARTRHAAEGAATFIAARQDFLRALTMQRTGGLTTLRSPAPSAHRDLAPAQDYLRFAATQTSRVSANISAFSSVPDPGIQQLRQALERERSALAALTTALTDRQRAEDKAEQQTEAVERSRTKALDPYQAAVDALAQSATFVNQEGAAWASYYQALAEASRVPPPVVAPAPAAPISAAPANPPAAPAPRRSVTPLPLTRYTGAWTYSAIGGMFHGAEPEFLDLLVYEENGKAIGTLNGRFKLPSANAGDPMVQFNFSGDFQPTRIQTFTFQTSDGAKGTIDLIPGNEVNHLEASFQIEPRPGKVRAGDLLLLKQ